LGDWVTGLLGDWVTGLMVYWFIGGLERSRNIDSFIGLLEFKGIYLNN
jgi:hypothetical protein